MPAEALSGEAPRLQVAVIGAGPSGFYATEALVRSGIACQVDVFERLATPHGLVRYGVAPDHQKLKAVAAVFDRIAADPAVTLRLGVELGRDVSLQALRGAYHAVIVATGTPEGRQLGLPGDDLPGVVSSARFVGWYNGHPDHPGDPSWLHAEAAVVIGHGNVAVDVARLLAHRVEALAVSDMPGPVLEAFAASRVRTIHLVGRGAPGRARFTARELRELGELPDVSVTFPQGAQRVLESLAAAPGDESLLPVWEGLSSADQPGAAREIRIWFGLTPAGLHGTDRLRSVSFSPADPGFAAVVPDPFDAGLCVTCIGYRGRAIPGLPFDVTTGCVPHRGGRVYAAGGAPLTGAYVTGWLKRGPVGVIGTNRADSVETVEALLADAPALATGGPRAGWQGIEGALLARGLQPGGLADWQAMDRSERAAARPGAPREKRLAAAGAARHA